MLLYYSIGRFKLIALLWCRRYAAYRTSLNSFVMRRMMTHLSVTSLHMQRKIWSKAMCGKSIQSEGIPTFLLLARYVPNVAKRSIWEQCKKKYVLRTDRPTKKTSHLGKFEMAISRRGVVRSTSCLFYGGVFEVGGSNGANSGLTKFNRYVGENNARRLIRLVTI